MLLSRIRGFFLRIKQKESAPDMKQTLFVVSRFPSDEELETILEQAQDIIPKLCIVSINESSYAKSYD